MRRLIRGFAGCTYHIVGNRMSQLILTCLYLQEPSHQARGALPRLIAEDMLVMSDFELHKCCLHYKVLFLICVVHQSIPSALFVRPEPYLSTYWSDLIHSCFSCFCCGLLNFCKIIFFKKLFQEHYQSVKWFGSSSGQIFCQS